MPYDDSDMKIAPNDPSELFDSSEGAATAFMRETQNGNMEKAKQLGAQFAAELSAGDRGIVNFGVGAYDDGATLLQRSVLFAYVVNQVVEDLCPASIVAQSVFMTACGGMRLRFMSVSQIMPCSASTYYRYAVRREIPMPLERFLRG